MSGRHKKQEEGFLTPSLIKMESTLHPGQGARKSLGLITSGKPGLSKLFLQDSFRGYIDPKYNPTVGAVTAKKRQKITTDSQNLVKQSSPTLKKPNTTTKQPPTRIPVQNVVNLGVPAPGSPTSGRTSRKSLQQSSSMDVSARRKSKTTLKKKSKDSSSAFDQSRESAIASPSQQESPKKAGSANSPTSKKLLRSRLTRLDEINSAAASDIIKIIGATSVAKKAERKSKVRQNEDENEEVAESRSSNPLLQLHLFPRSTNKENFFSAAASPMEESIFINELSSHTQNVQAAKYVRQALTAWTSAQTDFRTVVSIGSDVMDTIPGRSKGKEAVSVCDRRNSTDDTDRVSDCAILNKITSATTANASNIPNVSSERRLKRFRKRKKRIVTPEDYESSDTYESDINGAIMRKISLSNESLEATDMDLNGNSRDAETSTPPSVKTFSIVNSTQTNPDHTTTLKFVVEAATFTETKMATVSTSYTALSSDEEFGRGRSQSTSITRRLTSPSATAHPRQSEQPEYFPQKQLDRQRSCSHQYEISSNDEGDDCSCDSALVGSSRCVHEVKFLTCKSDLENIKAASDSDKNTLTSCGSGESRPQEEEKNCRAAEGKLSSKSICFSLKDVGERGADFDLNLENITRMPDLEVAGNDRLLCECGDTVVKGNTSNFGYPLVDTPVSTVGSSMEESTERSSEKIPYTELESSDRKIGGIVERNYYEIGSGSSAQYYRKNLTPKNLTPDVMGIRDLQNIIVPKNMSEPAANYSPLQTVKIFQQSTQIQVNPETCGACQTSDSLTSVEEDEGPEIFEGLTEASIIQLSEDIVQTINDLDLSRNFNKISDSAFTTFKAMTEMITDLVTCDDEKSTVDITAETKSGSRETVSEDVQDEDVNSELDNNNGNTQDIELTTSHNCSADEDAGEKTYVLENLTQVLEAQNPEAPVNNLEDPIEIPEADTKREIAESSDSQLEAGELEWKHQVSSLESISEES